MKKLFSSMLLLMFAMTTGQVHALDFDVVTGFGGSGSPAAKFYRPLVGGLDLVAGVSAVIPGDEGKETDLDLVLGVNAPLPIIGNVDIFGTWNKYGAGSTNGTAAGTKLHLDTLSVTKKWMYTLNSNIEVGTSLTLAEIDLQGGKTVSVLSNVTPVIGTKISF